MENKTFGKKLFKIIKIALISFGVLSAIIVLFLAFSYYEGSKVESKAYGICNIEYFPSDFTETELDKVANALNDEGICNTSKSIKVYLELGKVDSTYIITFLVESTSPKFYNEIKILRDKLQIHFPENKVIIKLSKGDYLNVIKTIE